MDLFFIVLFAIMAIMLVIAGGLLFVLFLSFFLKKLGKGVYQFGRVHVRVN